MFAFTYKKAKDIWKSKVNPKKPIQFQIEDIS